MKTDNTTTLTELYKSGHGLKAILRQITYSDSSKGRYIVVNNGDSVGRIKITAKQWNEFKKLGLGEDSKIIDTTKKQLINL